ncbi:ATPase, T2SS/T4P/T4SS family [Thiomicrorhabdus indica]|uniref:ATPase, T2SS/T4P/T4SS family n=1 Tax=Thiomicrorhabdus indica TaxID=2267253 RepID=UPI00102DCEAF|nr:ATPase, T2SS/T4P/T4SS family [Thiomicrorhabdus indica]
MSFTDIHIKVKTLPAGKNQSGSEVDLDSTLVFPGLTSGKDFSDPELIQSLYELCQATQSKDASIEHNGQHYRVYKDTRSIDGIWYRVRRATNEALNLSRLPSPLPEYVQEALIDSSIVKGGLIFICGAPGSGKTTTASATVVSRLEALGGMAYTVEDPPEHPINGRHGKGYCTQTTVANDRDWTESMRGVLRSQPANQNLILFVGEVRDSEAAQMLLRAASNGFLVICTGFGTDLVSSLDSFNQLLGENSSNTLASVLRVILHQKIEDGRLNTTILKSEGDSSKVASTIRSRNLPQLKDEVLFQKNQMRQALIQKRAAS